MSTLFNRKGARCSAIVLTCCLLGGCALWDMLTAHPGGDSGSQAEVRKHDVIVRPEGAGPVPAVILLHGCGGPTARDRLWAERLRSWGYLTLRVNSLAPRGLTRVCGGGILPPEARVPDVLAGLAYLRSLPDVDSHRIALMGWSHGGSTTLMTLGAGSENSAESFRAAIAFYPGCRRVKPWRVKTATLLLLGAADDWTAPTPCQALAERQQRAGFDVTQVTYSGAQHGFDNPLLGPNPRRVRDALGGRGATIQYNSAAAEDSLDRVRAFLAKHLEP